MREQEGMDRRNFLRKLAITGAAAWAAPVIQTVAAGPAFAQEVIGTRAPCFHSTNNVEGVNCMDQCVQACEAQGGNGCGNLCDGMDVDSCNPLGDGPCQTFCASGQGGDNQCCNPGLCNTSNFQLVVSGTCTYVQYTGSTVGCA